MEALPELVKVLEKNGVSAAAVAVAGPAASRSGPVEEGKSTNDVELTEVGARNRRHQGGEGSGLGLALRRPRIFVDGAPSMLKTGAAGGSDTEFAKKLEAAGAKVT